MFTVASHRLANCATTAELSALRNHDLSHLSGSLALAGGSTLADVKQRLGHANGSFTAPMRSIRTTVTSRKLSTAL